MGNEYLVPLIVVVVGLFQVGLNLWAGRKNSIAIAAKDEATATKEISESYSILIEALEARLTSEKERNILLCEENEMLRARIQQLEKEIKNGSSS